MPAMQRVKEFPGHTRLAPAAIESNETAQALQNTTFNFEAQLFDLEAEFRYRHQKIARRISFAGRANIGRVSFGLPGAALVQFQRNAKYPARQSEARGLHGGGELRSGPVRRSQRQAGPGHNDKETVIMVVHEPTTENRLLNLGPRLRSELERRVRELRSRANPSPRDLREIAELREFLKLTAKEGR